jgi:hypothetical protein
MIRIFIGVATTQDLLQVSLPIRLEQFIGFVKNSEPCR